MRKVNIQIDNEKDKLGKKYRSPYYKIVLKCTKEDCSICLLRYHCYSKLDTDYIEVTLAWAREHFARSKDQEKSIVWRYSKRASEDFYL